ncbi:helix-turn-helix domain-containing protein [Trabulsiella odontotermitis]|uniref:helix-turn-helix domain-containing protein n=1 Tax=Trabulsiella odontotermitis TaxID=379893 RepID=UPI000675E27E|nr:helix-turn-helix domain-containing protein [Trabulsiella odontotermitis]KNC91830.1 DNA-binding protein [Trabulsiella odontotermitis]
MNSTNQVKALRLKKAWSQEQLAEMTDLSVRTIQRIENGERPGLETLSALAAVFEVSVADLSTAPIEGEAPLDQRISDARHQVEQESHFWRAVLTAVVVCALLFALNRFTQPGYLWSLWVIAIWGALLLVRGLRLFLFAGAIERWKKTRLQRLLRK